ncbi:MAG: hypothetical protein AAGM84_12035 [Pseudomonadota bacterium]
MTKQELILRYVFIGAFIPMVLVLLLGLAIVIATLAATCEGGTCTAFGMNVGPLLARGPGLGQLFMVAGGWAVFMIAMVVGITIWGNREAQR